MKLKFLIPSAVVISALPVITLVSCSKPMTEEEENKQWILVNNAADEQYSPKIELTKNISIGSIDKNILKFKNNDSNLFFEVLNVEIPLINSKDTNINLKVSSKRDKTIFREYFVRVSDVITTPNFILEMTSQAFENAIKSKYLVDDSFSLDTQAIIEEKVKQGNFDISLEENVSKEAGVLDIKSIFDIPLSKLSFIENVQKSVAPAILNQLNEKSYQSNLGIKILDISKFADNGETKGKIKFEISISSDGMSSVFIPLEVQVKTFSIKYEMIYRDMWQQFTYYDIAPTLLDEGLESIPASKLYENYLTIQIPENLNYKDFQIGIQNTLPPESATSLVNIVIASKDYSDTIFRVYNLPINKIKGFEKIKFPNPELINERRG
ncbi:MAG: hypothetical protein KFW07_03235 [Mycoplasmataceae bacterium]|nr:hypothetical protein [Mycoplasmataceae bacterium]